MRHQGAIHIIMATHFSRIFDRYKVSFQPFLAGFVEAFRDRIFVDHRFTLDDPQDGEGVETCIRIANDAMSENGFSSTQIAQFDDHLGVSSLSVSRSLVWIAAESGNDEELQTALARYRFHGGPEIYKFDSAANRREFDLYVRLGWQLVDPWACLHHVMGEEDKSLFDQLIYECDKELKNLGYPVVSQSNSYMLGTWRHCLSSKVCRALQGHHFDVIDRLTRIRPAWFDAPVFDPWSMLDKVTSVSGAVYWLGWVREHRPEWRNSDIFRLIRCIQTCIQEGAIEIVEVYLVECAELLCSHLPIKVWPNKIGTIRYVEGKIADGVFSLDDSKLIYAVWNLRAQRASNKIANVKWLLSTYGTVLTRDQKYELRNLVLRFQGEDRVHALKVLDADSWLDWGFRRMRGDLVCDPPLLLWLEEEKGLRGVDRILFLKKAGLSVNAACLRWLQLRGEDVWELASSPAMDGSGQDKETPSGLGPSLSNRIAASIVWCWFGGVDESGKGRGGQTDQVLVNFLCRDGLLHVDSK